MDATVHYLNIKGGRISYRLYQNNAEETIVALHGYGQNADRFGALHAHFPKANFIAIDLPGHGNSSYNSIALEDWSRAMKEIAGEKFSLLAFSIGGAVALSLLRHNAANVQQIILLAPSGIGNDRIFDFAANTLTGRLLFRCYIHAGGLINALIGILARLGLYSEGSYKFLKARSDSKQKRQEIFNRWNALRHLRIKTRSCISIINKNKIPVTLVAGVHDPAIRLKDIEKFAAQIPHARLIKLKTGHRVYADEWMKEVVRNTESQ